MDRFWGPDRARFGWNMSLLTGILKIQCTNDLKEEIRKSGKSACILMMDEIKHMDNVADAWHPKDDKIDIIVEVDVPDRAAADGLKSRIAGLDGVYEVYQDVSAELS